jgi:hypothetical protein
MAVGILGVLSATGTTLIFSAGANGRTAEYSKDKESAYSLAEAGINEMMAVLSNPKNNALDEYLLGKKIDGTIQTTVHDYAEGTVEWSGTLNKATAVWSLTSIGRIKNPTGPQVDDVLRKLTAQVPVTPTTTQPLNNPSWNYIMSTQITGGECDMTIGNTVQVRTNLYVFGNLCLENQGKVLAGETHPTLLVVKGKVTQKSQHNTIGTSTAPVSEVNIGQGCKWFTNPFYNECITGPDTSVYATTFRTDAESATLLAPTANFDAWYLNAAPGPYFPCGSVSGTPPVFDSPVASPTASEAEKLAYKNNNLVVQDLAPASSSYSCKLASGGELTWDHVAKKLTVSGTMYIDGDARIQFPASTLVEYDGQGSIYLSGSLKLKNVKLCGGVLSGECDFGAWNPNTEMLAFVTNGENRQAELNAGTGIRLLGSQLQGALYATHKIDIDTFSKVDGPLVGSEVILGQSVSTNDFPNITTVPAGMPGNPTVYAQPNSPELYSG